MQEHPNPTSHLCHQKARNKSPIWKVPSLYQEINGHPYHLKEEIQSQEGCINTPRTSTN